ncbi:efflux RND transporter periplasmic adaptor subunit [Devosia sp. BK]|uniref:efflux RND transporter periplasmic adaptor subunit n=1 Tax=Devosia sp. BK TaxID=2871706 RepID=UPI00293A4AD3|nr:efflux RND transporter periplasmic adaptor subunit [Devosia sp. BK]MDV3253315.1 efflux RND transporter periplasmic adaptor subunit [Devosia sp. BK]
MNKFYSIALTLVLASTLAACSSEAPPEAPIRPVLSIVAGPNSAAVAGFVGVIEPQVSVDQSFRVGGTLVTRTAEVGDTVSIGDPIATLDATTYDLSLETARANLQTAQAQYDNAAASEGRLRTLNQSDVISTSNLEESEQQTEAARAGLVQAQSRVKQAEEQLAYTGLKASIDGVVTAIGAEPGAIVAAGQAVVTIAQPQDRDLVIDVPEEVVQGLSLGDRFAVVPQLAADVAADGTLREIAPQADPVTRTWRLRIGLENPSQDFWLGTTASAVPQGGVSGAIELPQVAIKTVDGATSIFVVNETDATVSQRNVTVAPAANGFVTIQSGLESGERVVIAGVNSLADGQKIKLEQESK